MYRSCIDINCDMGEAFGRWQIADGLDERIMPLITSANVACGFHAGDPMIMDKMAKLAQQHGVGLGAHPGYRDLQGFGRRVLQARDEELIADIVYQTGALREFGRRHGISLQHVKPHGALYMEIAAQETLSKTFIEALRQTAPDAYVFCMDISKTFTQALEAGQPVVRELFADRDYDDTGSIVFTRGVGPLDPAKIAAKAVRACREGKVETVTGQDIDIAFESICFHSDTPGCLEIATALRTALEAAGIRIAPPSVVIAEAGLAR